MAAPYDIALQRGEDWSVGWQLCESDDSPIDLTDCVIAGQVRPTLDNTALIATFDAEVTDPLNGEITLTLKASEGSPLYAYGNALQVTRLPFDIRLIYPDESPRFLIAGHVVLSRGVTHQ
jgi:hypothetical protein